MKYDVFISYSRRDFVNENGSVNPQSVVAQLLTHLENAELTYWIDRDGIYTGDEFQEVICTAIEESRVFLFVSSKASNASSWTPGEVSTAVDLGMPIVPLRVDETLYNKKIRIRLAPLDRIDLFRLGEKGFPTLVTSLKEQVKRVTEMEREKERKQQELDEQTRRQQEEVRKQQQLRTQLEIQYNVLTEQIVQNEEKRSQIMSRMADLGMEIPVQGKSNDTALMCELAGLKEKLGHTEKSLSIANQELRDLRKENNAAKDDRITSVVYEIKNAAEICLKQKFFVLKGRASLKEFWYFMLFELMVYLMICSPLTMLGTFVAGEDGFITMFVLCCFLFIMFFLIPNIAVSIRRLHDTGRSGWWFWVNFIPYIGGLIMLVLLCLKGEGKENKYSE